MYDRILVATDGSDHANRATEYAIDLASTFETELYVISVVDTGRYSDSLLSGSETVVDELEDRADELVEDVKRRANVEVSSEVRSGRPHEEIGDCAASVEADLIVLGHRGRGQSDGIGSIAERVVRNVDRPVLTT